VDNKLEKVLVSGCLLGEKVRYDGRDARVGSLWLDELFRQGRVVSLCPEIAAGFPTPRSPNEIVGSGSGPAVLDGSARIRSADAVDSTDQFIRGAEIALRVARENGIRMAILKEGSPSCGSNETYDGTFTGTRIKGMGVVAALLTKSGIRCFSEKQLQEAQAYFEGSEM
jgi:uncharacterized protein YbbK (DUF523 family)